MSLRKEAKILGVHHSTLSRMISGKRPWNQELKERYEALVGTTFGTTMVTSSNNKSVGMGGDTRLLGVNISNGGAEEARTPDPLLAKQVLSQLSYSPSYTQFVPIALYRIREEPAHVKTITCIS